MAQGRRIRNGLVVGLIGYITVAGFYAAFDLLAARGALYTVDLLGKSVFRGLRDTAVLGLPMQRDVEAIVSYNGFHLLIALGIGLFVTWLVDYNQRRPQHARIVLAVIVAGFFITIVVVGLLTRPIRPLLPWWSIVSSNAIAMFVGGAYLLWIYPDTWSLLNPFRRVTE